MDAVLATPSWAYDFCYYYAFVAAIVVVSAGYSVVRLLLLPALAKKVVPVTSLVISLVLSALVTVVLTMMQFWICRGALKHEPFAVQCKSPDDCTDVTGTPQGPDCTCGGRGFCGGCVMQNNMESNGDLPGN
jgi:hypothetical protein